MKCKARGCKGENFYQSPFVEIYGFCPDCRTHIELTADDLAQLASEGLLKYEEHERLRLERQRQDEPEPKKKPSKKKAKVIVAKKAASRKVKKGSKERPSAPKAPAKESPKKQEPKDTVACSKHPSYGVIRAPRSDCKTCWSAYKKKHPDRAKKLKKGK